METINSQLIDGELHVTRREKSHLMYLTNPPRPAPDRVWKEIYGVEDGKIFLKETIEGKHTPGHYEDESIIF